MSEVCARICGGVKRPGGVLGYPLNSLYEEVAFVAYHFHWPREEIYTMPHPERREWTEQINRLNRAVAGED